MKPVTTDITVLKNLIAIRLDVNIWSARKKLTPADFVTPDLPPESLASLGCKKVCNPEDLRIFGTLKARAIATLDRHGVRFLGCWVIPEAACRLVIDALDKISADFTVAKDDFLGRYDDAIRDWIGQNPGWEKLISSSLVKADTVRDRLAFAWQMFKIVPPKAGKLDAGGPLRDAVTNLGNTLFGEIAKVADEAWHKSFAGKVDVSAKAVSPLRGLRHKLASMSFIEPRVASVVDLIDEALNAIPEKGPIAGANLIMLQGLVCLLRDPGALVEHGQKIIDGQKPEDALRTLVALPAPIMLPKGEEDESEDDDESQFADLGHEPMPQIDSLGLW